jgi:hypothetical protein
MITIEEKKENVEKVDIYENTLPGEKYGEKKSIK